MLDSRFLFVISLSFGLPACGGDDSTCGVGDAPVDGLLASANGVQLTFTGLTAGANNDCPDPTTPDVVSLSIMGTQKMPGMVDGPGIFFGCIPRPDLLETPRALGLSMSSDFQLVSLAGSDASCTYKLDDSIPPTGTATGENVCDNGVNPAGFILTMDAAATLERKCNGVTDTVTVQLSGSIAVNKP